MQKEVRLHSTIAEERHGLRRNVGCKLSSVSTDNGVLVLEFDDVKSEKTLTPNEQSAVFEAAIECCRNDIDSGPFEKVINMLALRVLCNTYKRENKQDLEESEPQIT